MRDDRPATEASKVPEITLAFWAIKIVATTLWEAPEPVAAGRTDRRVHHLPVTGVFSGGVDVARQVRGLPAGRVIAGQFGVQGTATPLVRRNDVGDACRRGLGPRHVHRRSCQQAVEVRPEGSERSDGRLVAAEPAITEIAKRHASPGRHGEQEQHRLRHPVAAFRHEAVARMPRQLRGPAELGVGMLERAGVRGVDRNGRADRLVRRPQRCKGRIAGGGDAGTVRDDRTRGAEIPPCELGDGEIDEGPQLRRDPAVRRIEDVHGMGRGHEIRQQLHEASRTRFVPDQRCRLEKAAHSRRRLGQQRLTVVGDASAVLLDGDRAGRA